MARFLLVVAVLAAAAPDASADILKLYGELHGGGMYGKGATNDMQKGFFEQSTGPMYGVLVGGRLLIADVNVLHHQYPKGGIHTWTQFNLGLAFQVDTGDEKAKKEHKGGYVELGAWAGFGVATGAQVDPPLDKSEVSDQGLMLMGKVGFGKHLSKNFDLGLQVPVSWGYIFRSGDGAAANDPDSQYQSVQAEVLLVLRANIKLI
jgi:hypothetical protein